MTSFCPLLEVPNKLTILGCLNKNNIFVSLLNSLIKSSLTLGSKRTFTATGIFKYVPLYIIENPP